MFSRRKLLDALLEIAQPIFVVLDRYGKILFTNKAAWEHLGCNPKTWIGQNPWDLHDVNKTQIMAWLDGEKLSRGHTISLPTKKGRIKCFEVRSKPLFDSRGTVEYLVLSLALIGEGRNSHDSKPRQTLLPVQRSHQSRRRGTRKPQKTPVS